MNTLSSLLQPIKIGAHIVPGIWRYMLPEDVLYFRVDAESQSSCFNCPQVKAFGFHPAIRCCSYIPRIPNFLLGLALMDPGTQTIARHFIGSGYTIPEGSQVSPAQMKQSLAFLNNELPMGSVVCPLLDHASKKCQIYAFRSGVCSTFFCRHDQGPVGAEFWESLTDLVTQVETALAQWSLEQSGFDLEAYFKRFESLQTELDACVEPASGTWSEFARRQLFAEWFGREEELFLSCAQHILTHKKDLFEIASRQKLRQTPDYDAALRQRFASEYPAQLIGETLPEGEPVAIRSLWYSMQLSHRNLQLNRLKSSSPESSDSRPPSSAKE
ncbi:MAG: YkgJ family cysteine cluster protein [Pseudobdellovibrionaceae bacterium]|nr:YkgJ family cysteine cluster protein [Pseudobdellovibrionaceae bacterium]